MEAGWRSTAFPGGGSASGQGHSGPHVIGEAIVGGSWSIRFLQKSWKDPFQKYEFIVRVI